MNSSLFGQFIEGFQKKQKDLLVAKGNDYTEYEDDRLSNFKLVAQLTGQTPIQVWSVYWMKHVIAITNFIKKGELQSESIESRFIDASNYELLGLALIEEADREKKMGDIVARELSKSAESSPVPGQTIVKGADLGANYYSDLGVGSYPGASLRVPLTPK